MDTGLLAPSWYDSFWLFIAQNWALFSILATLAVLVIIPTLVIGKYVRIALNIMRDTEPPLSMTQVCFDPVEGEGIDFYASDGTRLRGMFLHPTRSGPSRGLVIFAPEFKSRRQSCSRYCRPLLQAGYDIFSFDFRGQGESANEVGYTPRQWASDREVADMRAAIAFCEQWLEDQDRPVELGLFGISRGACAAILAAEDAASVRCIVCDGAFSSDCTLEHLMKRWAKIFAKVRFVYENHPPEFWRFLRWCLFATARVKFKCRYPSVRKVLTRMIPRPLLFIHGERDSYIPVDQSRLLYALSAQPRFLWIVPRAKHNQSVDVAPLEYARRTVDFLDRYLSHKPTPDNIYTEGRFEAIAREEIARQHTRLEERQRLARLPATLDPAQSSSSRDN